jgi:6-phosphogluconolactonase
MIGAMGQGVEISVAADAAALADEAAETIVDAATEAVAEHGRFTIALAGGSTPRATYTRLAQADYRERVPWNRTWVFFGDERCVPPDHPESNYRMASAALLSRVPIPPEQIFPMRGEVEDVEAAAADYIRTLGEVFRTRRGELPRFDLILLGMGIDGHTASLFPGSPALKEVFRPVAAVHAAAAAVPQRLTLTFPVLNAAARVTFLVAGAEKARAVRVILGEGAMLPAAMVQPENGRLLWMLDRAAAAQLPSPPAGPERFA